MIGIVIVVAVAVLLAGGYLTFDWWLAGRERSDLIHSSHDQQMSANPNKTKALNARQGISVDGQTWTDI